MIFLRTQSENAFIIDPLRTTTKMSSGSLWLRYLPAKLRTKIEHRPNLQKVLGNTAWLFFDKIVRMGMGLLVGVWLARYLGPERFGLINYATAIVALFSALATLGLNNIVVRDLIKHPEDTNATLGTAFLLQTIGGGLACVAAVIAVGTMRPNDATSRIIALILGLTMVFKASDVIRCWFEARIQSKYTVWAENAAFFVFAAVKVTLILNNAPLLAFVWSVLAETILSAALLIAIYTQQGKRLGEWKYKISRAMHLLRDSWPLILSGLAAMIYMRIDQIMLGQMLGDDAVGVYSAALRLSEVWYFIPMTIAASVFPTIIETKKKSEELYHQRLKQLFDLMVILALALALPISFLSEWIVLGLYGRGYAESAQVLVIHVWAGIFVFLGVASSRWFITENLQKYTFYRTLTGCLVNIILNFLLIPHYGPIGSAWASVISQAVASVFFNAFNAKTRPVFMMQIKAIAGMSYMDKLYAKK